MAGEPSQPISLSARDGEVVLGTLSALAKAQLPISEGLRAAAIEATNGRVRRAFLAMAGQIEQGRSVDEACGDDTLRLPPHVRGMVAAAARTGQLGIALEVLVQHHRAVREKFWSIWASLAYPFCVLGLTLGTIVFFGVVIIPVFDRMFAEFELPLPVLTEAVLNFGRAMQWSVHGPGLGFVAFLAIGFCTLLTLAWTGRGGALAQRVLEGTPLFGVLLQWSGASAFCHLLGALLDKSVPLPESLQYTADGMYPANLRSAGRWLAKGVADGRGLAELVEGSALLPASAVPLLRWGERNGALPEALHSLSEMFDERVRMRTAWLRSISPPMIYIMIGLSLGAMIVALFMPLVSLIQGLS